MDHDHDHNHGSEEGAASCPMIMTFHGGHCERILWNGWLATTVTEFALSALAIFLVSFMYEALKFLREQLLRNYIRKENERIALDLQRKITLASNGGQHHTHGGGHNGAGSGGGGCPRSAMSEIKQKTYTEKIMMTPHLIQCGLNLVQIIISYLMMLIFMTFNYWLCLAVVLGLGVGYFFFGWIKQEVYENECCQ